MTDERKACATAAVAGMIVAALAALALAGCAMDVGHTAQESEDSADAKLARLWGYQSDNTIAWVSGTIGGLDSGILIDQETGVEYLIVRYRGTTVGSDGGMGGVSVTPLLNADGTPYKAVE